MLRNILFFAVFFGSLGSAAMASEQNMPAAGEPMGDPAAGQAKAATCMACHGMAGAAILPDYPNLGGQHYSYLLKQMRAFKSGERYAVLMAGQLDNVADEDLRNIAAYYAEMDLNIGRADDESLALGERIFRGGLVDKQVPACLACHSPRGRGNGPAAFPSLAGQNAKYMVDQLKLYRSGERQTDENLGAMMRGVSRNLNDEEIQAVANYVSGLQ